jgi:anti-anti-sigma factor
VDLKRPVEPDSYAAQWLTVDIAADQRVARVNVAGELDRSTTEELLGAVAQVLDGPAPALVELNLADLHFVDSAGIRCLLNCRTAVEAAGSRLMLVAPGPHVVRALDVTGLLDLFGLAQPAGAGRPERGLTGHAPPHPRGRW